MRHFISIWIIMIASDQLHIDIVELLPATEVIEYCIEVNLSFLLDIEPCKQILH